VEVLFSFSAASSSASSASVSPINIPLIHSGPKKNHQILALWKPNPPTHTESTRRRPWFFRFWGKNPWNRPPLLYLPMRMGISFSSAAVPELRCRFWYSGGEDLALLAAAVRSRSARPVLAAPFSLARSSPLTPAGWMKRGFPSLDLGTSFFFCFVRCAQFRSVAVSFVLHIAGTLRHCFVLPRETVAICAFFLLCYSSEKCLYHYFVGKKYQ
jgi:hypothetical protein